MLFTARVFLTQQKRKNRGEKLNFENRKILRQSSQNLMHPGR